jgi:serine/threonine-protein kinase RsbT
VLTVSAAHFAEEPDDLTTHDDVAALMPMVRRIVAARVKDRVSVDDLVQETLVRVLAAKDRVEPGMLQPYAIVTARNVIRSSWSAQDVHRRHQHRLARA